MANKYDFVYKKKNLFEVKLPLLNFMEHGILFF